MIEEITPHELSHHGSWIDAIYAGKALGCVVRQAARSQALAEVLHNFTRGELPTQTVDVDATITGCMLAPTAREPGGPTFDTYLGVASLWHAAAPDHPVIDVVHATLSALAQNRPVVVPTYEDRPYARATLRTFATGAGAPLHNDRYPPLACRAHLETLLDNTTQVSWYLVLAAPDAGGELTVEREGQRITQQTQAGDLVVFDGARWDHRVEPTRGASARRTLGGFAGLSQDREILLVWG